jgi:hypothetical protein
MIVQKTGLQFLGGAPRGAQKHLEMALQLAMAVESPLVFGGMLARRTVILLGFDVIGECVCALLLRFGFGILRLF